MGSLFNAEKDPRKAYSKDLKVILSIDSHVTLAVTECLNSQCLLTAMSKLTMSNDSCVTLAVTVCV